MTKQNREDNKELQMQSSEKGADEKLDLGFQYLSNALRLSFIALKLFMIALVILFIASGFRTVEPNEEALVLRFGKIRGVGEDRILGPGAHWVFPYPVDEIVKIPVGNMINLSINSFWYYQTGQEIVSGTKRRVPPTEPLNPVRDGYCITRSEKQSEEITGVDGSDYNIVHSKWQLTFQIVDSESFFKNVYVEGLKPGQDYFDVITRSINPMLKAVFEDAVVTAMVHYSIDEALSSQDRIPKHVQKLMQQKLTQQMNSGIQVESVQLIDMKPPRQVEPAFQKFIAASNDKEERISKAKTEYDNILNEAAGPVAHQLFDALHDKTISEQEKDLLWSRAAGAVQAKISQARADATEVVEDAEADAEYLNTLLPEYRQRPELVIQKIHRDAVVHVLEKADKKIMIQPTEGEGGREVWIRVGED
jgi:membrane protease subunit HflK